MVDVIFDDRFTRAISKIKDAEIQKAVKNKIKKIVEDPETGKPMRNVKKGTREVYLYSSKFRISYDYSKERNLIEFLEFYHKDEQ